MSVPALEAPFEVLGSGDGPAVLELCAASLPDEALSLDDLEGVVLLAEQADDAASAEAPLVRCAEALSIGRRGEDGALDAVASVSMTEVAGLRSAHLQLLIVDPAHRRRGIARALVEIAEDWASANGSTTLTVGAGAPFYLFTGVDSRWTDALCCFEALGYDRVGAELDLVCATVPGAHVSPRSTDVGVAHITDAAGAEELDSWVRAHYPHWAAEFGRAAAAGTVVVAADGDGVLGAAAHSVSRLGVIGPVAVSPARHGGGIGARLMDAVLQDLSVAGLRSAEIAWTSTVRFYSRVCGARVGRASIVLRRQLVA